MLYLVKTFKWITCMMPFKNYFCCKFYSQKDCGVVLHILKACCFPVILLVAIGSIKGNCVTFMYTSYLYRKVKCDLFFFTLAFSSFAVWYFLPQLKCSSLKIHEWPLCIPIYILIYYLCMFYIISTQKTCCFLRKYLAQYTPIYLAVNI